VPDLIIATRNPGKFREIREFLEPRHPKLRFLFLADIKGVPEILEDGSTFLQNAQKKATLVSTFAKKPTLSDDSGLEVAGLGGRPGVLSARFAGVGATDEQNVNKLLEKLKGASEEDRHATFKCAMVLAAPNGHHSTAVGELKGQIVDAPRGTTGFGYDPVFLVPQAGRTLAEMTLLEKNRISHRAAALTKISNQLDVFLAKV
jgi:XTP/dITP diphosphohydrolase